LYREATSDYRVRVSEKQREASIYAASRLLCLQNACSFWLPHHGYKWYNVHTETNKFYDDTYRARKQSKAECNKYTKEA